MHSQFDRSVYGQSKVTVVILARNEERSIGEAVRHAVPFADSVVVMDGHSKDRTVEVARAAGARVYQDPGRGKGSAIRRSLEVVDGDVVVFMDADGSHDPADIPDMVLPIVRGETDMCVGSRFAGGSDELSADVGQLIRTIGNISMNIAINKRWNVSLTDTLNGFRGVRLSAVRTIGLREDRHTIEQEMVARMLAHGFRVTNVPAHEYPRQFGESHINILREWPMFVWCVARCLARPDPAHAAPRRAAFPPAPSSVPKVPGTRHAAPDAPAIVVMPSDATDGYALAGASVHAREASRSSEVGRAP